GEGVFDVVLGLRLGGGEQPGPLLDAQRVLGAAGLEDVVGVVAGLVGHEAVALEPPNVPATSKPRALLQSSPDTPLGSKAATWELVTLAGLSASSSKRLAGRGSPLPWPGGKALPKMPRGTTALTVSVRVFPGSSVALVAVSVSSPWGPLKVAESKPPMLKVQ